MDREIWIPLIVLVAGQVIATFIAKRKSIDTNTFTNVEMKTDISYIKENIKVALDEQKKQGSDIVENKHSINFAHTRVDRNEIDINKNKEDIEKLKQERRNNNGQ